MKKWSKDEFCFFLLLKELKDEYKKDIKILKKVEKKVNMILKV